MLRLSAALLLGLLAAGPAAAQWPTTEWEIEEGLDTLLVQSIDGAEFGWITAEAVRQTGTWGDRTDIAEKHAGMLRAASRWFESLRFPAPYQLTEDEDLTVDPGEAYLATLRPNTDDITSAHSYPSGRMALTTNPGFLHPDTPIWTLMEASAVHELFHGIQKGISRSYAENQRRAVPAPDCGPKVTQMDWLGEGTASAVQIRWIEGTTGAPYPHPYIAPGRASWVRYFDQPLHRPTLPLSIRGATPERAAAREAGLSWQCGYGTWYFWYAVGEMLGRTDGERVGVLRYLFDQPGPWTDGGLANVDAGLREAAEAFDAIGPYRGGLAALYPEFVAQYLTDDRFYETVHEVDLAAPGLFQASHVETGGPLGPVASRAWRVRVRLPGTAGETRPYTVRFSLEGADGADRDALHLIVDTDVVGRPVDPTAPYTLAMSAASGGAGTASTGPGQTETTVEYLVRVANVAPDASATVEAGFELRVEVEGFYGEDLTAAAAAEAVAGELPPGFDMHGPGPWTCRSGADPRGVFDLVTPDEQARDLDRMVPETTRDMEDILDNTEIMLQRIERQGRAAGMTREQLAEIRARFQAEMAAVEPEVVPEMAAAAAEARAKNTTRLLATFVGESDGGECQMTLGATLQGREGGAQILAAAVDEDRYPEDEAPTFTVGVFPAPFLTALRTGALPSDPGSGWEVCTMTEADRQRARQSADGSGCAPVLCTEGEMVLERAEQGRIAGSFRFEVLRWPEGAAGRCATPQRETVTGHFNVASTDDGFDDNSLTGVGAGFRGGPPVVPGAPILSLPEMD